MSVVFSARGCAATTYGRSGRRSRAGRWWALPIAAVLTVSLTPVSNASSPRAEAVSAADCSQFTTPILRRVNPSNGVNLLTSSTEEAAAAAGTFTVDDGTSFNAAPLDAPGTVAVHRLTRPGSGNMVWIAGVAEIQNAVAKYGYVDIGGDFAASLTPSPCLEPVYRVRRGGIHEQVASAAQRDDLVAQGWVYEKIAFYAAPSSSTSPPVDPTPPPTDDDSQFTIAVIPDSQLETQSATDGRFAQRTQWLVDQRQELDLRYVLHTGDLVNWDDDTHSQYEVGSKAMKVLDDADIRWASAIGNHDTGAVCPGGSACPGKKVKVAVRDTTTYNTFFPTSRHPDLEGTFEPGKVDNSWSSFEAGGSSWLVLSLELWPRPEAMAWAENVVATHPDHNVIVITHNYLAGDGSIDAGGDYGVLRPTAIFDSLVNRYDNVKLVFSGHVGEAAARQDVRADGTTSAAFLGTFHSRVTNPVQLITIDTAADTVSRQVEAPWTGEQFPGLKLTYTNMGWE